ncbi:DUF3653 domain-containing protein [Photobacterium sagamiensis]|uniref:DUF3653 domain-containing protein n=1 Tax=Photobacterium sagamiensis TaxID=2910241 RepID=UPI003D147431
MTKKHSENYIFRKFICGLSKIEAANLCFKTVRTVTRWDSGQEIPPECRRLMKMYSGRELGVFNERWEGWRINKEKLIIPGGWSLTPDSKNKATIIQTARRLKNLPTSRR